MLEARPRSSNLPPTGTLVMLRFPDGHLEPAGADFNSADRRAVRRGESIRRVVRTMVGGKPTGRGRLTEFRPTGRMVRVGAAKGEGEGDGQVFPVYEMVADEEEGVASGPAPAAPPAADRRAPPPLGFGRRGDAIVHGLPAGAPLVADGMAPAAAATPAQED